MNAMRVHVCCLIYIVHTHTEVMKKKKSAYLAIIAPVHWLLRLDEIILPSSHF